MPNTKSAERRVRSSARKEAVNQTRRSQLKTTEKRFRALLKGGKKDEAKAAFTEMSSTLDKAAETGVITRATADRKKSRLNIALNAAK